MKIVSSCFSTTPDNKQLHYLLRTESIKSYKVILNQYNFNVNV